MELFKSKSELDRHVRSALAKVTSDNEKNLRGLTIARLYFKSCEYASAQHYLHSYLSVKEDSAVAHKMLGQCYLHTKKPEKALAAFQRSLQLDPKQHDLLIEVCKLLLSDTSININKAKYWCDLAEAEKIQNDVVFSLRLKLLNKENMDTKQVEEIILKDIAQKPNDINLRVRLLKYLVEQNKIVEAFKNAYDFEMKSPGLLNSSLEWYNTINLVLSKYKNLSSTKKSWDFWLLLIISCEKLVELSFSSNFDSLPNAIITEISNLLFNFDQCLFEASKCAPSVAPERELAKEFLKHYRGQFCLYAAAFLFKRQIVQNKNHWNESIGHALPLLLLAYQCGVPDTQELWLKHARDLSKQMIQLWRREGSFRCSQAGRTLLTCFETSKDTSVSSQVQKLLSEGYTRLNAENALVQVRQYCSDNAWRNKLFRALFSNSDQIIKMSSSLFINCPELAEPNYEFPIFAQIESHDEIAQYYRPQSLPHMVYLCLGYENLADIRCRFFNGFNFSVQNLHCCGSETLNQLDVDTFLYANAIQAERALEVEKTFSETYGAKNSSKPKYLPFVVLSSTLCTEEQTSWWTYAYRVYKNLITENMGEVRATLQAGIEAVRGINGPRIDIIIVFKLAKIFVMRSKDAMKTVEKGHLETRAFNLYKYGLQMMKMHSKGVLEPFRRLFKYGNSRSSQVERDLNTLAEEAVAYLAGVFFKNAEYDECIEELAGIQLPFAKYFQAEAYKKLDESNKTPKKNKKMYLERAKEYLNQTLDLIENTDENRDHPLKPIVQSEIQRLEFTNKYSNDTLHSVSFTDAFEDALGDTSSFHINHNEAPSRKNDFSFSNRSSELQNLVKQMVNTLTFLKEEVTEFIKPEVMGIKGELAGLKLQLGTIEENLKKKSNAPSRDDEANDLGDLYIIEDELQNQLYGNQQNMYPNFNQQHPIAQQNQRIQTPNTLLSQQVHHPSLPPPHHQQPPAVNPYNSSLYNAGYPMNYFSQYMMSAAHPQPPATLQGLPRPTLGMNQHPMPFADHTFTFNAPPLQTAPPQQQIQFPQPDSRSNLYGLLTQNTVPAQEKPQSQQSATNIWSNVFNNGPVEKAPPVNVVITSSDPLPTNTGNLQQPALSVTIPSHHIKTNALLNEPISQAPAPVAILQPGSNVQNTIAMNIPSSNVTVPPMNTDLGAMSKPKSDFQFLKTPDKVTNQSVENVSSLELNRSGGIEYDPRPDFKPVIPLPKEIEVITGEEDEDVLFCSRAKLFRYVDKEWKERGLGDMKILKNKQDGKTRILMRWDQTHKICANHLITDDMKLTQAKNEEKSYIWAAKDFADGELKVEKLCVRFKQVEVAKEFYNVFMKARDATTNNDEVSITKGKENTEIQTTNSLAKTPVISFAKPSAPAKTDSTSTVTTSMPFNTKTLFATPIPASKDSSETTKPSPFANFTFNAASAIDPSSSQNYFSNIFSSMKKDSPINSTEPAALTSSSNTNQPLELTKSITGASSTKKDENLNRSGSEIGEDYEPTAQFQPVIPLPDLVEVQTGEENDEVLFEHRAKLLRFDKTTSEWKDRGIGDMKILMNKDNPNLVRLVMRREAVHKVCCNQRLTKDMKFKKVPNSETALSWCGQDFSESEILTELLTIRFKTPDACKRFHDTILKAQENMQADSENKNTYQKKIEGQKGFGEKFKPKPGSWNCSFCYVQNAVGAESCVACGGPNSIDKSNVQQKQPPPKEPTPLDKSTPQGFGDKFKPAPGSWSCKGCYVSNTADKVYCAACDSPKDDTVPKKELGQNAFGGLNLPKTSFTFGFPPTVNSDKGQNTKAFTFLPQSTGTDTKSSTTFSFGITSTPVTTVSTSSFTFGLPSTSSTVANQASAPTFSFSSAGSSNFGGMKTDDTKTLFGGAIKLPEVEQSDKFKLDKKEFNFTLKPKSTGKVKSPLKGSGDGGEESDEENVEEENSTYFAPVIPLPDKIEIKTGEEDEHELYCHRAKLYRFAEASEGMEWKERGLGDVKILQHQQTQKLRVVMRREKILKICLNHVLTEDVEYKRKDNKSWHFIVNDFSEGEITKMHFCLRFKNPEIADDFMVAIKKALGCELKELEDTLENESVKESELEITSKENRQLADSLQLPYKFFDENNDECQGCRGCDPDEFVFPNYENVKTESIEDKPIPLDASILEISNLATKQTQNSSDISKPAATENKDVCKVETQPKEVAYIWGGNKVESTTDKAPITFSFINAQTESKPSKPAAPAFISGGFLFGNAGNTFGTASADKAKPIFGGGMNIFSDTSKNANTDKSSQPSTGFSFKDSFAKSKSNSEQTIFGGGGQNTGPSENIFSSLTLTSTGSEKAATSLNSFGGNSVAKPTEGQQLFSGNVPLFGVNAQIGNTTQIPGFSIPFKNVEVSKNGEKGSLIKQSVLPFHTFKTLNTETDETKLKDASTKDNIESKGFNFELESRTQTSPKDLFQISNLSTNTPQKDSSTKQFETEESSNIPKPALFESKVSANFLNAKENVTFASLAESGATFVTKENTKEFVGLTHTNDFSNFRNPQNSQNESTDTSLLNKSDASKEEYDPHFEPIIPLPNLIEVKTGEEDEQKVFEKRATLFRYDDEAKQWKERGVGDLKILYHAAQGTYRLLLRRYQIHKLVLNHAIAADFNLSPMGKNEKAFIWAAQNFAEDIPQVEKLAVRFKDERTAKEFSETIENCVVKLKERAGLEPEED